MSLSADHRPRDAEHAVLYRVIDEHLDASLETARRHTDGLRLMATVEDPDASRAILAAVAVARELAARAPPHPGSLNASQTAAINA